MSILVLNCGSSSIKYQLIEIGSERVLARGDVEKVADYKEALESIFSRIPDRSQIKGVGHRVVHGGERFRESVLITDEVVEQIEKASELAPLHNPHNLKGIYAGRELLPEAAQAAVFDTAFHHTLPEAAFMYGLPYDCYERERVRRYGFHGTSYRYLAGRFAEIAGRPAENFKLIACHLGNGCSVCAIHGGKSVDTSMGFTPLEGLLMGTRAGDLDCSALLYIAEKRSLPVSELNDLVNKKSGLLGISGISGDMRDLEAAAREGNPRARLAIDVFCYRVKKYIGSYIAALNGADAIIFAGGIGENAPAIRARICESMEALGMSLDEKSNAGAAGREMEIGLAGAKPRVWVIPTNEELLIARDTARLLDTGPSLS